jgi:hypothetical protein
VTFEAAAWRQQGGDGDLEGRQHGGGDGGVEERVVAWRLENVNMREREICFCVFNFV